MRPPSRARTAAPTAVFQHDRRTIRRRCPHGRRGSAINRKRRGASASRRDGCVPVPARTLWSSPPADCVTFLPRRRCRRSGPVGPACWGRSRSSPSQAGVISVFFLHFWFVLSTASKAVLNQAAVLWDA